MRARTFSSGIMHVPDRPWEDHAIIRAFIRFVDGSAEQRTLEAACSLRSSYFVANKSEKLLSTSALDAHVTEMRSMSFAVNRFPSKSKVTMSWNFPSAHQERPGRPQLRAPRRRG